jgi:Zn-dependent peptidase ImmA (M78 family)
MPSDQDIAITSAVQEQRSVLRGEDIASSKMTESQVIAARKRWKLFDKTDSAAAMAREFGVTREAMRRALYGMTWSHLPGAINERPIIEKPPTIGAWARRRAAGELKTAYRAQRSKRSNREASDTE